jgi:hypothetical protein
LGSAWKFEVTICDSGLRKLMLVKVLQKNGVKLT